MSKLKETIERWNNEVEKEEIALIEQGVPPYEAMMIATALVRGMRRDRYIDGIDR